MTVELGIVAAVVAPIARAAGVAAGYISLLTLRGASWLVSSLTH